jgi:hypothetical protein
VVKKYRVVFLGLIKSREHFIQGMSRLGVSYTMSVEIIRKAPVILKGSMTLGRARPYADAIQDAGGRVQIQESGIFEEQEIMGRPMNMGPVNIEPFDSFIRCPECGHKQLKAEVCIKCSHLFQEK